MRNPKRPAARHAPVQVQVHEKQGNESDDEQDGSGVDARWHRGSRHPCRVLALDRLFAVRTTWRP